jgi:hypothetical protein
MMAFLMFFLQLTRAAINYILTREVFSLKIFLKKQGLKIKNNSAQA